MNTEEYRRQISRHRSFIMGLAIIVVMLHHSQFFSIVDYGYLNYLTMIGTAGVDIFLFVSSFGLYYAFSKNSDIKRFYYRRLIRILPTFFIIYAAYAIFHRYPLSIFSLSYWYFALYSNWYITFILFMYMLFPFLYYWQKKYMLQPLIFSILLSISFIIFLVYIHKDDIHDVPMLSLTRFPIFMAGMLIADERVNIRVKYTVSCLALCTILMYFVEMFHIDVLVYPLAFFWGIFACLFFSCHYFHNRVGRCISYLGTISLEMYLIHMILMPYFARKAYIGVMPCIAIFILTIMFSELIHKIVHKLFKFLNYKTGNKIDI